MQIFLPLYSYFFPSHYLYGLSAKNSDFKQICLWLEDLKQEESFPPQYSKEINVHEENLDLENHYKPFEMLFSDTTENQISEICKSDLNVDHCEQPSTGNVNIKRMRKRIFWSDEETEALEIAMTLHGTNWTEIATAFGPQGLVNDSLARKTASQMKDKARNEKRRRIKDKSPLGPFYLASS